MAWRIHNLQKEVVSSAYPDITFSSEVLHRKFSIQESMAWPRFSTDENLV